MKLMLSVDVGRDLISVMGFSPRAYLGEKADGRGARGLLAFAASSRA